MHVRHRLSLSALALGALLALPGAAHAASTCTFDAATDTVTVGGTPTSPAAGTKLVVDNTPGGPVELVVNDNGTIVPCTDAVAAEDATTTTTDSIVINGTAGDDLVEVHMQRGFLQGQTDEGPAPGVSEIEVSGDLLTGADRLVLYATTGAAVNWTVGTLGANLTNDDDVDVTVAGVDTWDLRTDVAGAFADTVTAQGGAATGLPSLVCVAIATGAGNDSLAGSDCLTGVDLLDGGTGTDAINGALGVDRVTYEQRTAPVTIDVQAPGGDGEAGENDNVVAVEQLVGGSGNDVLTGSGADEQLDGNGGNDTLTGLGGVDELIGDAGNDTARGGDGNDTINTGENNDTIIAEAGPDGADAINAGNGSDELDVSARTTAQVVDLAAGTASDGIHTDTIASNFIEDVAGGSAGDSLVGDGDNNVLIGGAGNDTISGGGERDDIVGGAGNDAIDGGSSSDDILEGSAASGSDTIAGGSGNDDVHYNSRTGSGVVIAQDGLANDGQAGEGDNVAADVESLYGTSLADTIVGGAVGNQVVAAGGNDVINGGGGNDSIDASTGNDTITDGDGDDSIDASSGNDTIVQGAAAQGGDQVNGGTGTDVITYAARRSNVTVVLLDVFTAVPGISGGANERDRIWAVENALGGAGHDTLVGQAARNRFVGGAGNDKVNAGVGADGINGGAGNDRLRGGPGNDVIDGTAGADSLDGGFDNDVVRGGPGNDAVSGGVGNDQVRGGSGNDTVAGGKGSDSHFGESGRDFLNTRDRARDRADGGAGTDRALVDRRIDRVRRVESIR